MYRQAIPLITTPRGSRHLITMNSFQQPFAQVMASVEAAPPEDQRPLLTADEYRELRPASKQLRLDMRRYWQPGYQFMPLAAVKKHLEDTAGDMPYLETGTSATATVVHCEDGPRLFYLQWKDQVDRLNLITFVLNALNQYNRLSPIYREDFPGKSLEGMLVVAARKGDFARAFVFKVISRFRVFVYFMDFGEKMELEIDRLRVIPPEFTHAGPLCFPAFLNLELENLGQGALNIARSVFSKLISVGDEELRCEILDVKRKEGERVLHQVGLWKLRSLHGYELSRYIRDEVLQHRVSSPLADSAFASRDFTDACKQIFMDTEIDIPPYLDKEPKRMKRYRFVNVVSPSEFYLQHCYDGGVPQWYSDMQSFYKDPQRRAQFRIRTKEIYKNRCYVWQDPNNNTWNRVRVVNYTQGIGPFTEARLWLLDRGKFVVGELIDMMELSKDYIFGALAFRGYLCHIKPLPEESCWSERVVKEFKSMCTPDKLFDGVAVAKEIHSDEDVQGISLDQDAYGMILGEHLDKENRGTLQCALAMASLVIPAGLAAGRHDLAYMLIGEPSYCRIDMERELNVRVQVDVIQEQTDIASSQLFLAIDRKEQRHLVRGIQVKVGFVRISEVITPDDFYIQMEDKMDDLYKMEKDLGAVIEHFPALPKKEVYSGVICAAEAAEDKCPYPFWSRVVVISVDARKDRANAIYIDHGYERYVKLSTLRALPPYFSGISPFCHRAHLDFSTIENLCMPSSITWDDDGCWRRYIESWNTEGAIYYAWQLRPGGEHSIIPLEEFHQTLNFDKTSMMWYAGRLQKTMKYLPLRKLRSHPLLKQFFCSIGVDMVFECENADFPVLTEPAWTLLKDIGQVVSIYD